MANTALDTAHPGLDGWPTAPGWLPLTEAAVARIAAIDDAATRNLWITMSYADLGRRLLGQLETDQTWCTFAIWASNTAGASIRGEELPHVVDRVLFGTAIDPEHVAAAINSRLALPRRLGLAGLVERSHVEHLVAEAVTQVSAHIGHGNALVYGELAPLFVRLLETVEQSGRPAPDQIDELLTSCGVPSPDAAPLVHLAFRHYALAIAADARDRPQHVLAANIAAVLHEQQRLQPDISAALDAGLDDFGDDVGAAVRPWVPGVLRRATGRFLQRRVERHLVDLWQGVATHLMMTLSVPGEVLHLGRDVPPLADGTMFPVALVDISLPDLTELLSAWDPTHGSGRGSAAHDWAVLHQRMGYIVNLFRSRQRHLALTSAPLTQSDLDQLVQGRMPSGV